MRFFAAALLILWIGCGSEGPGPGVPVDTGLVDVPVTDLANDGPIDAIADDGMSGDDSGGEDMTLDDGAGETEPIDKCPGSAGCPCNGAADCESSLCVPTMDSPACATPCVDGNDCPVGWDCEADPGTILYCRAPNHLCRPCVSDLDCQVGPAFSNFCLEFGPQGRFCVTVCDAQDPCPEDYGCVVKTHGRAVLDVCVPADDAPCPCRDEFIEQGYETVCYVENEYGRCEASRTCDESCGAPDPAQEKCNGVDDDCDGATDEDVGTLLCFETNQFGTCSGISECIEGSFDNCSALEAEAETCNLKDDDCDGVTDNGIEPLSCENSNQWGTCTGIVECVDGAFAECVVDEPAAELCNGKDDDCDGTTDEDGANGCTAYCADVDLDLWGNPLDIKCRCESEYPYTETKCGDCADDDLNINPDATEICNDKDDDCDGSTDEEGAEGCDDYYFDNDGDGYSLTGSKKCLCEAFGKFTAKLTGDCNDTSVLIHPGAPETCNGVDDDCDGLTDEDLPQC